MKRSSTSGYGFLNAGAESLWGSKLQTALAVSTYEAELIAGARAIKEALWLRNLYAAIDGQYCAVLMGNQSALNLAKNPAAGAQTRTKHFDVQCNFARYRVKTGEIDARFVSTQKMVADVFTEHLAGPVFRMHRLSMGIESK